MALERRGVPTAALHTSVFQRVVRSVAQVHGMPRLRQVFVPQPVVGQKPEVLRAYVYGKDPTTGRPVADELVASLTAPTWSDAPRPHDLSERTTPRLCEPDAEENLQRLFLERGWTDQLPIVLPTEERVAAMLACTKRKPDEVVGRLRPTEFREFWQFTVEKVAANAVLAGARPEYFPVILALAASGITARKSTTGAGAPMVVVNGPIRTEIGMNSGIGALGPYNHANATIGRAYGLLSQNLQGGSVPGVSYMGSQGDVFAYSNVTFAENEERSPWEPLHVQHGFSASDSTVSIFSPIRSMTYSLGVREGHWRDYLRGFLRGREPFDPPTFLLDPIAARQFVERGGFATKQQLIDWAYETARMPVGQYWDSQLMQNYVYPRATSGEEPFASTLRLAPEELVPMFRREDIQVVVVGGETHAYWRIAGASYQKTLSVDEWR